FQAEDGIRDSSVTGVQTCALPIWFKSQHIDPRTYFKYRDGASHPANEMAVSSGQVDLATDYDRNLNSMIERGLIKREDVKIVWTSEPLPNDPMVVRKD